MNKHGGQVGHTNVPEKESLKDFTMNKHGGQVGQTNWTVCSHFYSLSPRKLYVKLLQLTKWLLRRCMKLSYYESHKANVKQ